MPLTSLPAELLVMIAKNLSYPPDLKNLTETLPELDALLLPLLETSVQKTYFEPALSWAAFRGHVNLVRRLLQNGADVNAKKEGYGYETHGTQYTALHKAAMCGKEEVVKLLLGYGCDRDAQMKSITHFQCNGTALHCAAFCAQESAVRFLLGAGADVNCSNNYGRTALHVAVGCSPILDGHHDVIKLLLEAGADINALDENGRTALHLGIGKYFTSSAESVFEVAAVLLDAGVGIDVRDRWGKTALHCAAMENDFKDVINLLMERGANVSIKDHSGLTPVEIMVKNRYNVMMTGNKRTRKGGLPFNTVVVV